MKMHRESFYRCVFSSPKSRRTAHVRAWDAGEAAQLFKMELKSDGVAERGTIEVFSFGEADAQVGAYRP